MSQTYWWQEKDDPKPVKVRVPVGAFYASGYADGFHGRPVKRPRGKRAREAYDKGYAAGQTAKQPGPRQ
jgi:hypothetical protein